MILWRLLRFMEFVSRLEAKQVSLSSMVEGRTRAKRDNLLPTTLQMTMKEKSLLTPFHQELNPPRSLRQGGSASCPDTTTATAISYDPDGIIISGTTEGASSSSLQAQATTGDCAGGVNNPSPTVWYKIQSRPSPDLIFATTCFAELTEFDTVLTVLVEDDDGECTCVVTNDNDQIGLDNCVVGLYHSSILFESSTSTTYYIAVSGSDSSQFGRFDLMMFSALDAAVEEETNHAIQGQQPSIQQEARIAIEIEPLFGSFGGSSEISTVKLASEVFFRSKLNSEEDLTVDLVDYELLETTTGSYDPQHGKEASNLWVDLRVSASILGSGSIDEVLETTLLQGFVDGSSEEYIGLLKVNEFQVYDAIGKENVEYFASVERVAVGSLQNPKLTATSSPTTAATQNLVPLSTSSDGVWSSEVIVWLIFGVTLVVSVVMIGISYIIQKKGGEISLKQRQTSTNIQAQESDRTAETSPPPVFVPEIVIVSAIKESKESKIGIQFEEEEKDSGGDEEGGTHTIVVIGKINTNSIFADQGLRERMILTAVNHKSVAGKKLNNIKSMIQEVEGELTITAQSQLPAASTTLQNEITL